METYYFESKVNFSVEEAVDRITEFLKPYGFGILTQIDVQKTLKEKIGADIKPYRILGACNPNFAKEAISKESNIGLLLPCNIIVQEKEDGSTLVATINPEQTVRATGNQDLNGISDRVKQVMQSLISSFAEIPADS